MAREEYSRICLTRLRIGGSILNCGKAMTLSGEMPYNGWEKNRRMSFFSAGAAKIDITPPLNVGILMSSIEGKWSPFKAIRKPLYARVVVLTAGTQQVAIVSLDLLGLTDTSVGGWERFKRSLGEIIPKDNIIIHSTHTHSAPETLALTALYKPRGV